MTTPESDAPDAADEFDGNGAVPPVYKMRDLLETVASQSDLKRSELKETAGLVLEAMAGALRDGRALSLPGLGKISPRKREEKPSGLLVVARIKLPNPAQEDAADGGEIPRSAPLHMPESKAKSHPHSG